MPTTIIGLDIGTTSISAVAVGDDGSLVATVTMPHSANVGGLPDGHAEQDPQRLLQSATEVLAELTTSVDGDIACIGITGQMHSTVLLDKRQEVLGNIITWQDKRALQRGSSGESLLEELRLRAGDEEMLSTGCRLSPGYMGTTLYALRQLDQLPTDLQSVSFVADWIAARLTDQPPVTDRSHAASSGLYNLQDDTWSSSLLSAANVPPKWLPQVNFSDSVIGNVTPFMATTTGIKAGTPVCNAIGDNQASVISSLPLCNDSLLINIGTGGQIAWRIHDFQRIDQMDTRYLPPDRPQQESSFMLVGAGLCGGDALAWINRTVRQWLAEFGIEKSEAEVWEQLNERMAAGPSHDEQLTCEPFFAGTRPNPQQRASFAGVGVDNFSPANIAASILRGIAESMHSVYAAAEGRRPDPLKQIVLSGNGARQNPLLVEAVAERFGVPATVSRCHEEAATGAAMLAGVSIGCWPSLEDARRQVDENSPTGRS